MITYGPGQIMDLPPQENILLPSFYDHLRYVIYNGPPQTLYAHYSQPVQTPEEIAEAILVCGPHLYNYILHPSLTVTEAYCRHDINNLDKIPEPSRELIVACLKHHPHLYLKYKELFPNPYEVLHVNAHIIKYIEAPSEALKLEAVRYRISALKFIGEPTFEVCEYVAKELHAYHAKLLTVVKKPDPLAGASLLQGIAYTKLTTGIDYSHLVEISSREYPVNIGDFKLFNEVIVDNLIRVPEFVFSLDEIPEIYWTRDRLQTGLKCNPQILKSYPHIDPSLYEVIENKDYYPYIPEAYQTPDIKIWIESNLNLKQLNKKTQKEFGNRLIKQQWEEVLEGKREVTQELCKRIFDLDPKQFVSIPTSFQTSEMIYVVYTQYPSMIPYIHNFTYQMAETSVRVLPDAIRYIPGSLHTEALCMQAVSGRGYNLRWCQILTRDLLAHIFKTTEGSRMSRFSFLQEYSEAELLRILAVRPNLLMYLKPEQQTDTLIRKVLALDGFAYQYVLHKTPEYLALAMANEPRAIKYC